MKNLFIIDGASGTGKSDLLQYVDKFKTKVSMIRKYTTRSQRDYEKEKDWKLDLDFISQEDFEQQNFDYQYKYGKQWYGFYRSSLDDSLKLHSNVFVIVRNTDVIKQLIEDYKFINVVPVYIYTDQEKIRDRLMAQKVTEEQLKFRLDRIREAFEDYLLHPQIYREVLINNSNIAEYHRLIDILLDKYKGTPEIDEKLVFVMMSFNRENRNLVDYYNAMKRAVEKYDPTMKCINMDELHGSFKISDTAKKEVKNCRLVIVDLTENKHNVFYELGYIHGTAKDCIITAHKDTPRVFYSSEYRTLYYENASELEQELLKNLKGILGEPATTIDTALPKRAANEGMAQPKPIKILFLAANPSDQTRLRLDNEIREIEQALSRSEFRDKFQITQHWAVRDSDLQGYLLKHKPDIVHFSSHGSKLSEIVLEDDLGGSHPVTIHALSKVFSILKENIKCVILNACYSDDQAQAIADHIDCVIGMSTSINDLSAIRFSKAFYQAIGYGMNIKTAFDSGCAEIDLANLDEQDKPKLIAKNCKLENISFL